MRFGWRFGLGMLLILIGVIWWQIRQETSLSVIARPVPPKIAGDGPFPGDAMWRQRAYPYGKVDSKGFYRAQKRALADRALTSKVAVSWVPEGPTNIPGRIPATAVAPDGTIYAGSAAGGVWKMSPGDDWTPIFDAVGVQSVGAITLDPTDPNVIYVGTGEANGGGGSVAYSGQGVFKSVDGGVTWQSMGLFDSAQIGRIVVDPSDPQTIYVAALGEMYRESAARGVYRSQDGGQTWALVLHISQQTGVVDLAIDPQEPERLYAVAWQRIRFPDGRDYGGPECGVYRSEDGGDTWTQLTKGLPEGDDIGRMGIAVSASHPNQVVVCAADRSGDFLGVYRSKDYGTVFTDVSQPNLANAYATFGWWFGQVRIHPEDPDVIYLLGLDVWLTFNGGHSWQEYHDYREQQLGRPLNNNELVHVDQHDLVFQPGNPDVVISANDGGVYRSTQNTLAFQHLPGLNNTQFYTLDVHPNNSLRLYGGTQDNGTMRTDTGNMDEFYRILGGDGFRVIVPPNAPEDFYAEFQYGGLYHFRNFNYVDGRQNIPEEDRFNWSAPVTLDPSDPAIVYFGSQRVWATSTGVENFAAISPDLTDGPGQRNVTYGTLTTIAVAPSNGKVLYVGTDDGNVWTTRDGGEDWLDIADGLPDRWITWITVDPRDELVAYVSVSGARWNESAAQVFKTTDGGDSWQPIGAGMPDIPVNQVKLDPKQPDWVYAATDVGVMITQNQGLSWEWLGVDLPPVPVTDMDFDVDNGLMFVATYGRGLYRLDINAALYEQNILPAAHDHIYALPDVRGEDAATKVLLVNPHAQAVDVEIVGFGAFGERVDGAEDVVAIPANGKLSLSASQTFADGLSWVRVAAAAPVYVFAELASRETRSAYWAGEQGTDQLFLPHIAQDIDAFETSLTAVNLGVAGMGLQVLGNGDLARPFGQNSHRSHGQDTTTLDRLFGQDLSGLAYATLEAGRDQLAAVERFATLPNRQQDAALGLTANRGHRLDFPHVAADNLAFWTGLVYFNPGEEPVNVDEVYYDQVGKELGRRSLVDLPPGNKVVHLMDHNGSTTLPLQTARVMVNGNEPLVGYALFGSSTISDHDFFAGLQGVYSLGEALDYPHFQAGEDRWLGLVAVNLGEAAAAVTFTLYGSGGNVLAQTVVPDVQPGQKLVRLAGDMFPEDAAAQGAWVRAEPDAGRWAGFLLWGDRGNPSNRYLAGMLAQPR